MGNWVKDEKAIESFFEIEIEIYNKDILLESLVGWPCGALGERIWGIKNKK